MHHSHSAASTTAYIQRTCQLTAFLFTAQPASPPDTDTHSDTLSLALHCTFRHGSQASAQHDLWEFVIRVLLRRIIHTAAFAPKASAKSYASPDALFCCFLVFFFKALAAWGLNWPDALYSSAVWSALPKIVSLNVFKCANGNRPIFAVLINQHVQGHCQMLQM